MKFFNKTTFYELIGKKMKRLESMPLRSKLLNFLSIFLSQTEKKMKFKLKREVKLNKLKNYYGKLLKSEIEKINRKILGFIGKIGGGDGAGAGGGVRGKLYARRLKKLLGDRDGLERMGKDGVVVKDSKFFWVNGSRNMYAWD